MKMKESKERVTVCLDKSVLLAIKELAEREDRAFSYMANSILRGEVLK